MEIISYIFEEYKELREESLQTMRNRNSVLTFGLATLGVIFLAGANTFSEGTRDSYWFSFFIFVFGIPVVSFLILMLWLGEFARMRRVGNYLQEREELLNKLIGPLDTANGNNSSHHNMAISWEHYLREKIDDPNGKTRQLKFPYYAVIALFTGIPIASVAISITFPLRLLCLPNYALVSLAFVIIGFSLILGASLLIRKVFTMKL